MMRYINKIGIELEGFFNIERYNSLNYNGLIKYDGSVVSNDLNSREFCAGEIASDPLTIEQVRGFIELYYPCIVNHTCGLHIHLSFNDNAYQTFIDKYCHDYIIENLKKYCFKKLKGNDLKLFAERVSSFNNYCRVNYIANSQLYGGGTRYTAINYSAYNKHKTIELRLLPMFEDKKTAYDIISYYLMLVERFLNKHHTKTTIVYNSTIVIQKTKKEVIKLCV